MSDAISRFDAQKLVYDYCHARTVEGRQLKSPAVFTTHTGIDLAEAIGTLAAVQPDPALLEAACISAHDAYEAAAHAAGWATNPQSRKSWAEVPEANKVAMRAGIGAALALLNTTGKEVMPDEPNANIPHAQRSDTAPAGLSAGGGEEKMALYDAILTGIGVLRVTHVDTTREEVAEALWWADKNGFYAQLKPRFADAESYNRNHWLRLADVAIKTIKGEKK